MTDLDKLDAWLRQATRHLAKDAAIQVRTEIREHYDSARDAAVAEGATAEDADRRAVIALGDARTANRQYLRVLLTSAEAKMLREGDWEARAFCKRPRLKRLILAVPLVTVAAAAVLLVTGHAALARDVFIGLLGVSPLVAALYLPINTPSRGRVYRYAKWIALTGALLLIYGPDALKLSWLLISCFWPLAWIEWTRASIRRKLPVKAWPRHLYL